MFTGLIEGLGPLVAVQSNGPAKTFTLQFPPSLPDIASTALGDSISLNGCCLTVVAQTASTWSFQAGAETLSRTNLGGLTIGSVVNLERATRLGDRLGGHMVQGHIDGTGRVEKLERDGEWTTLWIQTTSALTRQMVSKGSVAVDGVSLTLVAVEPTRFSIALIPHTLQVTTLGRLQPGDMVNLETDIVGKYVEKMLGEIRGSLKMQ